MTKKRFVAHLPKWADGRTRLYYDFDTSLYLAHPDRAVHIFDRDKEEFIPWVLEDELMDFEFPSG